MAVFSRLMIDWLLLLLLHVRTLCYQLADTKDRLLKIDLLRGVRLISKQLDRCLAAHSVTG